MSSSNTESDGSWSELKESVRVGEEKIATNNIFKVLFICYGALFQILTHWSSEAIVVSAEQSVVLHLGVLLFYLVALWLIISGFWVFDTTGVKSISVLVFHLGTYYAHLLLGQLLQNSSLGFSFEPTVLFIVFIEASILALVYGRSCDPLKTTVERDPQEDAEDEFRYLEEIDDFDTEEKVHFAELDFTLFWRWAQIATTFFVAFGIGIAATSPNLGENVVTSIGDIVVHSILSAVGIIYLSVFVLWKMRIVRAEIREIYKETTTGDGSK